MVQDNLLEAAAQRRRVDGQRIRPGQLSPEPDEMGDGRNQDG